LFLYLGLPFSELYNKCRERFLVNSDLTLRAQLTEFKDHKLIKTKKVSNRFNGETQRRKFPKGQTNHMVAIPRLTLLFVKGTRGACTQ